MYLNQLQLYTVYSYNEVLHARERDVNEHFINFTLWEAVTAATDVTLRSVAEWSNSQNTQVIVSTWVEGYVDI